MRRAATTSVDGSDQLKFFDFAADSAIGDVTEGQVPVFEFDPALSHNIGSESPLHRLFIGDNAHALTGLCDERFDLIYIDPPYNTGKQFVYADKYANGWCSFMYPRLKLAQNVLKDTGVIMVAIGLAEQHRLRMLMDHIFGDENFIGQVHWESGRKNDARFISNSVDYMLVYAKSSSALRKSGAVWRERHPDADAYFDLAAQIWEGNAHIQDIDERKTVSRKELVKRSRSKFGELPTSLSSYRMFTDRGVCYAGNGDLSFPGGKGYKYDVLHPMTGQVCAAPRSGYSCTEETMTKWIADGYIEFGADHTVQPKKRRYNYVGQSLGSVVTRSRRAAHSHVGAILGKNVFHYPKDHHELAKWIGVAAGSDAKVLDFFGGSGSTAEAVLLLNKQDGGTREVTIVTNNDNNIGTGITRERIVRVMTGENWADGIPHDGYGGRLAVWHVSAGASSSS